MRNWETLRSRWNEITWRPSWKLWVTFIGAISVKNIYNIKLIREWNKSFIYLKKASGAMVIFGIYQTNSCLLNLKSKLDLLGVLRKKYQILKWKVKCKKGMKDGMIQYA